MYSLTFVVETCCGLSSVVAVEVTPVNTQSMDYSNSYHDNIQLHQHSYWFPYGEEAINSDALSISPNPDVLSTNPQIVSVLLY